MTACAEPCSTTALIVAAGQGRRLDCPAPKAFLQLGESPLFLWSARTFEQVPEVTRIVLVVPADYCDTAQSIGRQAGLTKLRAVIPGGKTRCDSVFAGLQALSSDPPDLVAIHDGARPFVSAEVISRTIAAAEQTGAALAARPVTDTLNQVDEWLGVAATVDRTELWHAQTPQTFR
ncbi:MAG: 2-C-methyl-D-erythritol 4-phosphate cytidylyltransferase, partial [Armatimonadetes bacterium]|nr:2-C-methyl-D-erythritol 4-phosphate cytidylyltransferase [Armatimonadota bacterium]